VTAYRRSAQQVSCKIDGEVAILHLDRALYFGLQGAGADIWDALEQPRSVGQLRDQLVEKFDVSSEQCESDVVEILTNLEKEGLVETVG
jgi:hypothetical protein